MGPLPDSTKAKDVLNGVNIVQLNAQSGGDVKGQVKDIELDEDTKQRTCTVQCENGHEERLTADEDRRCLQIPLKSPWFMSAYHVTAKGNVENIRKHGFQSGDNPKRLRIGQGVYFWDRKNRAQEYLQRLSKDTGRVHKLLTCSIRTDGKLFYAGERCYFPTEWVGGLASAVLGRFHQWFIRDPKQATLSKIGERRLGRRFVPVFSASPWYPWPLMAIRTRKPFQVATDALANFAKGYWFNGVCGGA